MFRRYTISIELTNPASVTLDDLEKILGCSISEPSNWVEYGSTKERGLTFLDKEGTELASAVFVHQPLFTALHNNTNNEMDDIKDFVFNILAKHYPITPADIKIRVAEYNRL